MKLSDAQFSVLTYLRDFGAKQAIEVIGPRKMDGTRKIRLEWNAASSPTLAALERSGLVMVTRIPVDAPRNAVGKRGHDRRQLTIEITDAGRQAIDRLTA